MKFFIAIVFIFTQLSCSFNRIVSYSISGFIDETFVAVNEESNLEIAKTSIESNLKLLDGLLRIEPNDEHYLLLASQGYFGYSFSFVEDENIEKAKLLYLRSKNFAETILKKKFNLTKKISEHSLDEIEQILNNATEKNVPEIFWFAISYGSYLNLDITNPDAIADIPKVEKMMMFVITKNENYYYGSANFFMGTLYSIRPKMFGGDLEKSKTYFEKALKINNRNFLFTQLYFAKFYAVNSLDNVLFENLISEIENFDLEKFPEQKFANSIAKEKAKILKERITDLF